MHLSLVFLFAIFLNIIQKYSTKKLSKIGFVFKDFNHYGNRHFLYYNGNKKQTIILVHGFGANALGQWYKTAKILSKNYNIIAPDLLNHGATSDSFPNYSISAQANYIKQILDTLNWAKQVTLCGNSYGGIVATEFAHLYSEKVDKLILNDAVNNFFSNAIADSAAQFLGFKKVIEILSPTSLTNFKTSLKIVYYKPPHIPIFVLRQVYNSIESTRQKTNENVLQHLIDYEKYYHNRNYTFNKNTYLI